MGSYTNLFTASAEGNVNLIGYVSTDYGNRNIDDVKADIIKYNNNFNTGIGYSVTGIFFDEVSTSMDSDLLDYYSNLNEFMKNNSATSNLDFMVFNQGINAPKEYLNLADVTLSLKAAFQTG